MISLQDVVVDFGAKRALGPISVRFDAGGLTALMGPNGSGKTTLLKVMCGLLKPTSGVIRRAPEASVSYVAQHHLQHRWMPLTVKEVLRMSQFDRRPFPWPLSPCQKARIGEAVERLEIGDLQRNAFGELSGGQRQRVLIASAIATKSGVLLLDEPITGLDIPSQRRILEVVAAERDAGRVVVLSTHHLDEARRCQRVVLLNGTIVADGTPDFALTAEHLAGTFGARIVSSPDDEPLLVDDHGHGSHSH